MDSYFIDSFLRCLFALSRVWVYFSYYYCFRLKFDLYDCSVYFFRFVSINLEMVPNQGTKKQRYIFPLSKCIHSYYFYIGTNSFKKDFQGRKFRCSGFGRYSIRELRNRWLFCFATATERYSIVSSVRKRARVEINERAGRNIPPDPLQ